MPGGWGPWALGSGSWVRHAQWVGLLGVPHPVGGAPGLWVQASGSIMPSGLGPWLHHAQSVGPELPEQETDGSDQAVHPVPG